MRVKFFHVGGCAGGLLFALLSGACVARNSAGVASPQVSTNAPPRFVPYIPGYTSQLEIRWLIPLAVLEDYTKPENACSQKFTLQGEHDMVWSLAFAPGQPSYGAIVLRRTNDLSAVRTNGNFRLRIKPAEAIPHLRLAMVDGRGVVSDVVPTLHEEKLDSDWRLVNVPLAGFPAEGTVDSGSGTATFDWSAVREFRLIADGSVDGPVDVSVLRIWKEITP